MLACTYCRPVAQSVVISQCPNDQEVCIPFQARLELTYHLSSPCILVPGSYVSTCDPPPFLVSLSPPVSPQQTNSLSLVSPQTTRQVLAHEPVVLTELVKDCKILARHSSSRRFKHE